MKKLYYHSLALVFLTACTNEDPTPNKGQEDNGVPNMPEIEWTAVTELTLNDNENALIDKINSFGYELISRSSEATEEDNFCVSPLSASISLGLLANSTDNTTRNEILSVLDITNLTDLNTLNEKLLHYLPCEGLGSCLKINNRVWVNNTISVPTQYTQDINKYYNAVVQPVDFSKLESIQNINKWAYDCTNGLIKNILDESDPTLYATLPMLAANAVYFAGEWAAPFDTQNTKDAVFATPTGNTPAKMMHTTSENYYASNDFASLLILNYNGPDNHIELYLPQNALRQKDIVKMFTQKVIDDLRSNLQPYNVDIALPRANVHHKVQLNRILDKMGIKSIDNANLTPVGINAATPLHFEQNTALKIDEKGTEMAAVTTIAPTGPAPENLKDISVVFNRPFMFIIRNSKTDAILMAGTIVHP